MVISGEMEVLVVGGEEEEEDGDEFGVGPMNGQQQQQYGGGYGGGMDVEDEDGGVQLGYAGVPPPPPQVLPSSVLVQMQQQQQHHHAQQQQQHAMAHHQMHHPQQQHHQMSFGNGNAHAGNPFAHNLPPPPPSSGGGVMSSRPGTGGYDAGYFGYSQVNISFIHFLSLFTNSIRRLRRVFRHKDNHTTPTVTATPTEMVPTTCSHHQRQPMGYPRPHLPRLPPCPSQFRTITQVRVARRRRIRLALGPLLGATPLILLTGGLRTRA